MKEKTIAIVHYNTPELTEAAIKSIRKHGGEDYKVVIFDNSDKRPFKKRMKGVKVLNNREGQIVDFAKELEKYPERDENIGCCMGCYFGSDIHMMSVQKLWELLPDGFLLIDSDILVKKNLDWMFQEDECAVGYVHTSRGMRAKPRLAPLLLWINVPMCVAGGAVFFDPNRAWALHKGSDKRNYWDTGAALLDDIKRLKPQCHGVAMSRGMLMDYMVHLGSGSWSKNDPTIHQRWLEEHKELWN